MTWLSQPGKTYDLEYTPALTQAWATVGTVTPSGTAASWTDDGTGIGQPPGSASRPVSFYRVKQR